MNRPKKIKNCRRVMIRIEGDTERDLELLSGYLKDCIGVPLSISGVVRVALKRYLESMEDGFMESIKSGNGDRIQAFLDSEKKLAMVVNKINPKKLPSVVAV